MGPASRTTRSTSCASRAGASSSGRTPDGRRGSRSSSPARSTSAARGATTRPSRVSPPVAGAWTLGAFKTPQLRNVALTSPYGHGGNYANLSDVVELIRTGGLPAGSALTEGTTEPWLVMFDQANDAPITTFLQSLDMLLTH
jgi:cytochrome c peroxidase